MKTRTTLFNWQLPDNYWETGGINCPRKLGGCGRYHSFTIDSLGELEFDLSWESRYSWFDCEKFEEMLEEEARNEWEEEFKEKFLKENNWRITQFSSKSISCTQLVLTIEIASVIHFLVRNSSALFSYLWTVEVSIWS